MMKKIPAAIVTLFIGFGAFGQLQWPAVTQTAKPWTRWWWEGSAVNKADLTWNLEQYSKAGLGGVEITPIYGIHGYENQFINFLTPRWMDMLQHTLKESQLVSLGVDLANATGWPFGGPWVHNEDASKTIYFKTYQLAGGDQLQEKVVYHQKGEVRTANNKPASLDTIKNPVWVNDNLQALALDQIRYYENLPLQALIAYNDDKKTVDLTGKVDAAGQLNWTAPNGQWTLYALFEGLHGKMVERAAPGGEGYAIDHFSATAAKHYFKKFDTAFNGYDLSYLRGFFNDSYEVDDARGQSNWTPTMFDEFKKRKGYDLRTQLPALFGKADVETSTRVLYDYRSVIDELILENFTEQWKHWADTKGKIVRNQSHGSPANTLDLYSVVDIPETEGNDILRFKFATSAAHVTGKPLVSSESATWLNEHFLSSLGDVKQAVDKYFLGGVNHIFYHGTAYSPKEAPWPGWLFYAAVHFQPTNPQWKDFHVLNEYIARTQSFLQQGKPDNDILVYYPIADRYSERTNELLQHFDGMEKNFEGTDFEEISKWLLDNGYGFDFFSDRQLQKFTVQKNAVITGGNKYKVILVPGNKLMPLESMQQLVKLSNQGAAVIFYKDLPTGVPGFHDLDARSAAFKKLTSTIKLQPNVDGTRTFSTKAGSQLIVGNDAAKLLKLANVRQELLVGQGLQFTRRQLGDTTIYLLVNEGKSTLNGWVPLSGKYGTVLLFDAMTSTTGMAQINTGPVTNVLLNLPPGESIILKAFADKISTNNFPRYAPAARPEPITGKWTLEFVDGGPVLPATQTLDQLVSWSALNEDAKNFSGTAKYTTQFDLPVTNASAYEFDLGGVHETAEIIINGKHITSLIGPTFKTVVPATDLQQHNTIEIVVANLMANRIAYMDRNNLPWKIFYNTNMPARLKENAVDGLFNASKWDPLPSGLLGPVTITPLQAK